MFGTHHEQSPSRAARRSPDDHRNPPIGAETGATARKACHGTAHGDPARRRRGWSRPEPRINAVPMTGAQSLVHSLEAVGGDVVFGIPGGAILPAYDPLFDSTASGTSSSATSRARATPPTGTRRPPARSASAWRPPARARRTSSPPIADAYMDSVPIVAITGQVPAALIGTDAFQEADICGITLPITKHNMLVTDAGGHPAGDHRGVPHRLDRPARPGAGRPAEGRPAGRDHLQLAAEIGPARLPADDPAARQADPGGRPADRRRAPPGALRRRRRAQGARPSPELLRARRADRHPGGHHPDGPRRVPRQPPAAPGHARHARHRRRGRGDAEGPTCWSPSAPGSTTASPASSRPSPRTRKIVHADIDPAEICKNRRADVPIVGDARRSSLELIDAVQRGARRRTRPRPHGLVGAAGRPARDATRSATTGPTDGSLSPRVRHRADRRDRRPGRDLHGGRRPAPDVGGAVHPLREAAHVAQLRRAGHDGLRRARRDGREDGAARTRRCGASTATAASR